MWVWHSDILLFTFTTYFKNILSSFNQHSPKWSSYSHEMGGFRLNNFYCDFKYMQKHLIWGVIYLSMNQTLQGQPQKSVWQMEGVQFIMNLLILLFQTWNVIVHWLLLWVWMLCLPVFVSLTDWWPVQDVSCLLSMHVGEGFQQHCSDINLFLMENTLSLLKIINC